MLLKLKLSTHAIPCHAAYWASMHPCLKNTYNTLLIAVVHKLVYLNSMQVQIIRFHGCQKSSTLKRRKTSLKHALLNIKQAAHLAGTKFISRTFRGQNWEYLDYGYK